MFLTAGDIFPNASDRDGRTFDPIPIGVFNYSLDSSMDLIQRRQKTFSLLAQYIHRLLIPGGKKLAFIHFRLGLNVLVIVCQHI